VTAFHKNAVAAMERAGFDVDAPGGDNPHYLVRFAPDGPTLECFSKAFDDPMNPSVDFAAVMTCSDADAACPFVPGASARFRITYDDPKVADGAPDERATYDSRCLQIATEMLYAFSRVR
jgi:arsenate reductase